MASVRSMFGLGAVAATLALVSASAFAQAASPATARATPAPAGATPAPVQAPNSLIQGFRSAKFDMTEAQVRAAIVTDLGITADKIRSETNAQERTLILQAVAPSLQPGPGPATVTYILGATSKKLIKVSVVWAVEKPTDAQRGELVTTGMQISDYFRSQAWQAGQARIGTPLGPNTLSLFAGVDGMKRAIELVAAGISFTREENGKQVASPAPTGPAVLQISYVANVEKPDIYRIQPGAF